LNRRSALIACWMIVLVVAQGLIAIQQRNLDRLMAAAHQDAVVAHEDAVASRKLSMTVLDRMLTMEMTYQRRMASVATLREFPRLEKPPRKE
jgi:hypothetical protein